MKKILVSFALVLLPLSVMAMIPVSDSTLSDVTGQAGVNINTDLTINISIGTMAWGDADGIGGFNSGSDTSPWATVATGGYVGLTNFNIDGLRIKARETDGYNGYFSSAYLKPITIDVATGTKNGVANTTFVRFGLGSLYIGLNSMTLGVEMGPTTALGQTLGTVNIGPMDIYINPSSYIDIYAHAGSGVNFDLNIVIDQFSMSYISWGDTDGLPTGNPGNTGGVGNWIGASTSAGYIGLQNLVVGGPVTIAGTLAIDVVSQAANAGVYSGLGLAPILGQGATTVVHISFPQDFVIDVTGPITANVRLDSAAALNSVNAGTLGDIYLSHFNLDIWAGSWVDIWAH
jgi:hypothetical protein